MKKSIKIISVIVGLLFSGSFLYGKEKFAIDLEKVPAAVKTTIEKEAGKGTSVKIKQKTESGKTLYEAEFRARGKEIELKIAEDGSILGKEVEDEEKGESDREERTTLEKLPGPVKSLIEQQAQGESVIEIEKENKNGKIYYEIQLQKGDNTRKIKITDDGKILKEESGLK